MNYLLDTNIVSAFVNQNQKIRDKLLEVYTREQDIYISCISFYEVKRGLLYVNATRKLSEFNKFCQKVTILFLENLEIIEKATEIHINFRRKGRPIQDADILIAATAITNNLTLVSNDSDMSRVEGINLENWLDVE
ncbi:MAG: type II toxin-antitoxin system VapC family toxin [Okeania sp. SIO3I5]|uniref:type II toxin-antitoxin system VapC family toxin n=1 Tax=Okeania sp. SIO3I5 TaxID=2607805 RepID=UPI0013BAB983|nr:type II toxin-antitoxin system VapC family toxin [Okeania sp. SIO3I5]NEQ35788.1 type II toxin-antitoxin system VapC family toxin [Okeania sp. SIO3I5]